MYKTIIVTMPIIAILLGSISVAVPRVHALSAFDWGYQNGRAAYLNGQANNSFCDPSYGDSFCASYKLGYGSGWLAASAIYGNQSPP